MTAALRVVLADDHPVIRDGLAALLSATEGIDVVATAAGGDEAVRLAVTHRPDVLVMDLHMPGGGLDGVEATRKVRSAAPDVGILVLTMLDDDESVRAALDAGAAGYLLKGDSRQQIVRAIHAVAAGATILGSGVAHQRLAAPSKAPAPFAELTPRERQVLDMLATGSSTAAIAGRLGVATKTVTNNLSAIFAKLGVTGRTEAALLARDHGLGRP